MRKVRTIKDAVEKAFSVAQGKEMRLSRGQRARLQQGVVPAAPGSGPWVESTFTR